MYGILLVVCLGGFLVVNTLLFCDFYVGLISSFKQHYGAHLSFLSIGQKFENGYEVLALLSL